MAGDCWLKKYAAVSQLRMSLRCTYTVRQAEQKKRYFGEKKSAFAKNGRQSLNAYVRGISTARLDGTGLNDWYVRLFGNINGVRVPALFAILSI